MTTNVTFCQWVWGVLNKTGRVQLKTKCLGVVKSNMRTVGVYENIVRGNVQWKITTMVIETQIVTSKDIWIVIVSIIQTS